MNKSKIVSIKRRRVERNRKRAGGANLLLRVGAVVLGVILASVLLVALSGVGAVVGVWAYYTKDLPEAEDWGVDRVK